MSVQCDILLKKKKLDSLVPRQTVLLLIGLEVLVLLRVLLDLRLGDLGGLLPLAVDEGLQLLPRDGVVGEDPEDAGGARLVHLGRAELGDGVEADAAEGGQGRDSCRGLEDLSPGQLLFFDGHGGGPAHTRDAHEALERSDCPSGFPSSFFCGDTRVILSMDFEI